METTELKEKPCIMLESFQFKEPVNETIGTSGQKAQVLCHGTSDADCPKKKNKLEITMHCWRIRRPKREVKP